MPETIIGSAEASVSEHKDFSVASQSTDGPSSDPETEIPIKRWNDFLGYYKTIPELGAAIDAKGTWTVGKGYTADEETTILLDSIKGNGRDTINTIIENMIRTYNIVGDAFCEIIRDEDDVLINLKPLDPSTISMILGSNGMIKAYKIHSKIEGKTPKRVGTDKIFHLSRNRVADEGHGVGIIERLETIILMRNEAMDDWKRVLHKNIDPMIAYKLDTDDTTEIAAFKKKVDAAKGKGENMYIPKDSVEFEIISLAPNANLSPLTWIDNLNNYFYQVTNVPQIIVGGGGEFTEASAKIAYLAFQQTIEEEQLFIEESFLSQLNLVINLEFPVSLENELLSDEKKDGAENIDASDTTAGSGE